MSFFSLIGFVTLCVVLFRFFRKIGDGMPVMELLLSIAGLQWILGPIFSYNSPISHNKYFMYVEQETYMSYVVPAFLIFSVILLKFKKNSMSIDVDMFSNYSKYGKKILGVGILFDVLSIFAPPSLRFFFFLLSQFKFVGAGMMLFSTNKKDRIFFYGAIFYLVSRSLASAMFHDLLIWGVFMFMLWSLKEKPSFKSKVGLLIAGMVCITTIQAVKAPFREVVWSGYEGNKFTLFMDVLEEQWESGYLEDEKSDDELNVRLNQGWIISAIMYNTPKNEPFAEGSTVMEAFTASLLPRILNPLKKVAGGQENFERFTGLALGDGTSMGMSIIGEAYANYGSLGGIFFMAFWGWFLAFYWNRLVKLLHTHPLLLFFIPLIFLQVIKAETELVVVLNHLFKSSIVVALFFWFGKKVLNWEI